MKAEFEEKTYENYFNAELKCKYDTFFFAPGQIEEGKIGADSYVYSNYMILWKHLEENPRPRLGIRLKEIAEKLEEKLGYLVDSLPLLQINLLFQYKRPEYADNNGYKEWINWEQPYYRYKIEQKQQKLLSIIEHYFENNVLVLYAAPALHTYSQLITAASNNQIISLSNFCKVSSLKGHSTNTFMKEGHYSIACSKPEEIEKLELIKYLSNKNSSVIKNNRKFIRKFSDGILSIINSGNLSIRLETYNNLNDYPLLYSFLILNEFRNKTGLQWIVKRKNK